MTPNSKKAIKDAIVLIKETNAKTQTNFSGYFQVDADSSNHLIVRHNDYETGLVKVPQQKAFLIKLNKYITPEFEGGTDELYKFLSRKIVYPQEARINGTQGKIFVSFEIDSIKGLQNISIPTGASRIFGEEVKRVLKMTSKRWIPKTKLITLVLPVTFELDEKFRSPDIDLPEGKLLPELVVVAITK